MEENRRPIKTRSAKWALTFTHFLLRINLGPNKISLLSILFAVIGAVALCADQGMVGSLLCIAGIQLRLLCNLFDGMVAIEGGRQSPVGALYNEFPDRIADSVLLIALGYAAGLIGVGWLAALAAALTAYVRVFGGSLGLKQGFQGPMAKQHRMAVMTIALIANIIESQIVGSHYSLSIALAAIAIGSIVTCVNRTLTIAKQLEINHVDQ